MPPKISSQKNTVSRLKKSGTNSINVKDVFFELALVGILWILIWIPMTYFVTKYGERIISDAEYLIVARMAEEPLNEGAVSTDEARIIEEMASAPLE